MDSEIKKLARKHFKNYLEEVREMGLANLSEVMAEDKQYPGRAEAEKGI